MYFLTKTTRFVLYLGIVVARLRIAAEATAAGPYRVTDLGAGFANGINDYGQVVGWSNDGLDHAFLWTPGTANVATGTRIDLGDLLGGAN